MKIFINTIAITFLLFVNVIMGSLALKKTFSESFFASLNLQALLFGLFFSFSLVVINKYSKAFIIHWLSVLILLYVNFGMSRIIELGFPEGLCSIFFSLSEEILIISILGSLLISQARHEFNSKEKRIEFNYDPIKEITRAHFLSYFTTNMTLLMTNVIMETTFKGVTNNAFQFNVFFTGSAGIIIAMTFFLFASSKKK